MLWGVVIVRVSHATDDGEGVAANHVARGEGRW